MGIYDVNLKKTQLGYQFDHNVYIGYQTNDNRVVTFKDLTGYVTGLVSASGSAAGIVSVSLGVNGQELTLSVNGQPQTTQSVSITHLHPQDEIQTIPSGAKVCLLTQIDDSEEYNIYTISPEQLIPAQQALDIIIDGTVLSYDGTTATTLSLSSINTTPVTALSITSSIESGNNSDIPNVAAIKAYAGKVALGNAANNDELVGIAANTTTDKLAEVHHTGLHVTTDNGVTTLSGDQSLVLNGSMSGSLTIQGLGATITYNGSTSATVTFATIGTSAATTIGIAQPTATTANTTDVITLGFLQNNDLGGNVYSAISSPTGALESGNKFIFVEEA